MAAHLLIIVVEIVVSKTKTLEIMDIAILVITDTVIVETIGIMIDTMIVETIETMIDAMIAEKIDAMTNAMNVETIDVMNKKVFHNDTLFA